MHPKLGRREKMSIGAYFVLEKRETHIGIPS
jgi:hypothetical protein